MDKSFLIFIAVGLAFIYLIVHFISDIQEEDETFQTSAYKQKQQFDRFITKDSIGQTIIDVEGEPENIQIKAWNGSKLKDEMIDYFPDFSTMKVFIHNRVKGNILKKKLLKHINDIEGKFFSGTIDSEEAKKELNTLK